MAAELADNSEGSIRWHIRDGRQCYLCGANDKDCDDILIEERIYWGAAPRGNSPVGNWCLYCTRVYERRWKTAYQTLSLFTDAAGSCDELLADFKLWRGRLIEHLKASGGNRSARMRWEAAPRSEKRMTLTDENQIKVKQPDDNVMEEEDYIRQFGSPTKNGKGHVRCSLPGCPRGVMMPGPKIWTVSRSSVKKASLEETLLTNDDRQLGEDDLEINFERFRGSLFGERAAGEVVSMNSILGMAPLPALPAPDARAAPSGTSAGSAPSSSPWCGSLITLAGQPSAARPAVADGPAKGGKRNTAGKAKAKATPAGPGAAGNGRRGAPPRDLVSVCAIKCSQYSNLSQADEFWIDAGKNVRAAKRFYDDITAKLVTVDKQTSEWRGLKLASKKAHALHSIIGAWHKGGGYSSTLVKTMDEVDHFLQMKPYDVTDFRHPGFLLRQRHEVLLLQANGALFWGRITRQSLLEIGFEADQIEGTQAEFLAQKQLSLLFMVFV